MTGAVMGVSPVWLFPSIVGLVCIMYSLLSQAGFLLAFRFMRTQGSCRLNVLIVVEDVAWIVRVLEGDQALVVDPVGSPDLRFPSLTQEVRIDAFQREGQECALQSAYPSHVPLGLIGVLSLPLGDDVHDIRHLAQGKGGGGWAHPTHRPVYMLNQHLGGGRGAGRTRLGNEIDDVVVQFRQGERLLVVVMPNGISCIAVDRLTVGPGVHQVEQW